MLLSCEVLLSTAYRLDFNHTFSTGQLDIGFCPVFGGVRPATLNLSAFT